MNCCFVTLQNLTPIPSILRPHCLAKDQLRMWIPASTHPASPDNIAANTNEQNRVKDTMVHAWEEDTRTMYRTGLLMWHCFCDEMGVSEWGRAPASQALLSAFVTHMATSYSRKTISNYLNGVQAWHILHSIPWGMEKAEMDTILRMAKMLTPVNSKRKKCHPYTPDFIVQIRQQLNCKNPLNTAVFACLTTCFYASARLGEFTTCTLSSFNTNTHVTPQNLSYNQDCHGFKVTVLHLPFTKTAGAEGEDIYWALPEGELDPTAALQNHLRINQPSANSHLFAYQAKHAHRPLTKAKFLQRVGAATCAAGLEPLQGHSIQIGSTLKYLLQGVPFDVMKVKGRWAGNSFWLYL